MPCPQLMGAGSANQDTHRVYTTSYFPVGTFGVLNGTGYVWCSYVGSSALTGGEPLVGPELDNSSQNLACTTNCLGVGMMQVTGITAGAVAITANAFAEGYMMVVDGGGEGTYYRIRDHSAFTASTANGTINLYDPIAVVSDASTEVTLIANKYASVRQSPGLGRASFVGVPHIQIPAGSSTTQYFWAQRVGLCPVFVEGVPRRGTSVVLSNTTAGRLKSITEYIEVIESKSGVGRSVHELDKTPVVGQMATDAIDGEIQIVDLQNPLF